MKLRTSFFEPAVLKKDIGRFAPVWGLYSVYLILSLLVLVSEGTTDTIANLTSAAPALQLIYGGICAIMLFGDLFNPRLCNAQHALPMTRDRWFYTHLTAGMLFFLVPTGSFALAAGLLSWHSWFLAAMYFAVHLMLFLFFFGLGAFCAMCAGNRLGMAVLYCILNFLSVLAYCVTQVFYEPFLYGLRLDAGDFSLFSPVIWLANARFIDVIGHSVTFSGAEYWIYLGVTTLCGLIFLVLALLTYRRRNLESAGDFIAAAWVRPVFLGIWCLSIGMLFYLIGEAFDVLQYVFLLAGLAVGFFTGRMLLQRTVRVFKAKAFLVFGGMILILALSMGAMALDLFGIVHRVPEERRIQAVEIQDDYGSYPVMLEDADDIALMRQMHLSCLEKGYEESLGTNRVRVSLTYHLKGGGEFSRYYSIPWESPYTEALRGHFSTWECVTGTESPEALLAQMEYAMVSTLDEKQTMVDIDLLLEAMYLDCQAGTMAQDDRFHEDTGNIWVEFAIIDSLYSDLHRYVYITIYEDCRHTMAFLEGL